jgi:hypothetical protein
LVNVELVPANTLTRGREVVRDMMSRRKLAGLTVADADLDIETATVMGKGRKAPAPGGQQIG